MGFLLWLRAGGGAGEGPAPPASAASTRGLAPPARTRLASERERFMANTADLVNTLDLPLGPVLVAR